MTAFRGSSNRSAVANTDTTLSLPPASPVAQVGDTGIVWVTGAVASVPSYTPPSGWTKIAATEVYDAGSPGVALVAFWRRFTSADLAARTWGWDPAHGVIVALTVYSPSAGKMVQPAEAGAAVGSSSSTTRTTPSVTTAGPRWLSVAYADRSGSSWTPGAGQVVRHDANRGAGASSLFVVDSGESLPAGTYSRTATASAASGTRAEGIVALSEVDAPVDPDPEPEPEPDPGTEVPPTWLVIPSGFARIELVTRVAGGAQPSTPSAAYPGESFYPGDTTYPEA